MAMKLEIEIDKEKGNWRSCGNGYVAHGGTPLTCLVNLLERDFGSSRKETIAEFCYRCKPGGTDVQCSPCNPTEKLRSLQHG